jgi:hypothetical protein
LEQGNAAWREYRQGWREAHFDQAAGYGR